jgi:hypothetical protein
MSTLARRSGRKGSSFLLFRNKSYILLHWGAAVLRPCGMRANWFCIAAPAN